MCLTDPVERLCDAPTHTCLCSDHEGSVAVVVLVVDVY